MVSRKQWLFGVLTAIFIGGFVVPDSAYAAGFATTSQSATASSMANVGAANADEPNATYYNPAAVVFQPGFHGYIGGNMTIPSSKYIAPDGTEVSAKSQAPVTPNLHLGYATEDGLGFGLGLNVPFGQSIAWDSDWRGRNIAIEQNITTIEANPTISYLIDEADLAVSVGYRATYSSVVYDRGIKLRQGDSVTMELAGDGMSYTGFNAGVLWKATDKLAAGLQYRSGVGIDYDGKAHFEGEENTPFAQNFEDGKVSTKIDLPRVIRGGLSYQFTDKLFVEFDAIYTGWSSYDELVIDFKKDSPSDTQTLVNDWSNSWTFGLGGEYSLTDKIPLRLGVKYDQSPVPDKSVGPTSPVNNRVAGSLGTGYTFDNGLRADIGYQYTEIFERDSPDNSGLPGKYNSHGHDILLNIGYGY